jgi:hypothetical protein
MKHDVEKVDIQKIILELVQGWPHNPTMEEVVRALSKDGSYRESEVRRYTGILIGAHKLNVDNEFKLVLPELKEKPDPLVPMFRKYDIVEHRKGSKYVILDEPHPCWLSADTDEPYYKYAPLSRGKVIAFIRSQSDMEDGRFTKIE